MCCAFLGPAGESFFLSFFVVSLESLKLKRPLLAEYALAYKRRRSQPTARIHAHNPQHAHPPRVHLLRGLDLPHERRVTATSSTHRLSSTTTPLHVDSGNLKTSEPKASETLCARITSLPESRPQPRLRPAPHALRALACATTAHVPSCARARARVGRVLVLVPSCARARAILC